MSEKKYCACGRSNGECCGGKCCGNCHGKCSHEGAKPSTVNPFPAWDDESTATKIDVSSSIIGIKEHEEEKE